MVRQDDHQVSHAVSFGRIYVHSLFLRPAAQLSYTDAQSVIEGKTLGDVPVIPDHNASDIEHDIKILDDLAKQMRDRRFQGGAINTEHNDVTFKLDQNGMPMDCGSEDPTEANNLVEEFMLATNIAVAQQIAVHFPEQALLRRHDTPIDRRLVCRSRDIHWKCIC